MINKKIAIATPFYARTAFTNYLTSLVNCIVGLTQNKINFAYIPLQHSSYVDKGRNIIINTFLKSNFDELIFIDSDMGFDYNALEQLIKVDYDIVGAPYLIKMGEGVGIGKIFAEIAKNIVTCEWIASGFMKIKKKVFDKMKQIYSDDYFVIDNEKIYNFFNCNIVNNIRMSEDSHFCKKARDIGFKIYAILNLNINHLWLEEHTLHLEKGDNVNGTNSESASVA